MSNYVYNKKLQFLFPFLFLIAAVLVFFGFRDEIKTDLKYNENNSIQYSVYLKENPFFEKKSLPEGETYIASLIDYLDVTFHYNVEYNRMVTGTYKYKFIALVAANKKEGSGYYWKKEYDLTDEKSINITNNSSVSIDDNVKVDYTTYNEVLSKFKKEYGVDTNGELKVLMKINAVTNFQGVNKAIETNPEISLTVPLLEQALEIGINKDTSNDNEVFTIKEKSRNPIYLILKVTGFVLMFVSVFEFIIVTVENIALKKENLYEIKLNEILTSYDSIIANIKTLPNMRGFKLIEVSTFEEMLDVYNEVRMPINYYQEKNKSTFIIINDSIVWLYDLKKDVKKSVVKRVDNNEKKKSKSKTK